MIVYSQIHKIGRIFVEQLFIKGYQKISPYSSRREIKEMKELYAIMRDLLEVEYNQESLLYVLEVLDAAYEEQGQGDIRMIVNHTKGSVKVLQAELKAAINRMDSYIAGAVGQR